METLDYSNKRCLLVEDRRAFLLLLKGLLSNLGATKIDIELSAESALKACKTKKYDIIISDLHLGANRKNGFEFLEEIRKSKLVSPSTVFIMISGESTRSLVLGSLEKQPDDYLVKPFSQAQLNARIARATFRRISLSALYSQIDHEKYDLAIRTCKHYLETEPRYTNHLLKYLIQLYWKLEKYAAAETLLNQILEERPMQWAVSSMAQTQMLLGNYDQAIDLGKKVIDQSVNSVEAYDIVANAYLLSNKKSQALKYIQEALVISPLSIERHFQVCKIARENGDYELAMQSAKSIYELSQRSVHRSAAHLCGYVRSILDVAEHASDKKNKNRFLQESMLAMQRLHSEEFAQNKQQDFDFEIFETLVQARMQFIEGKTTEAKRSLEKSQISIESEFSEYPIVLAPDSLKVMLDTGDFEEAIKVYKILGERSQDLDPSVAHAIESAFDQHAENRENYIRHNKVGIEHYSQGGFHKAYEEFSLAKQISPLNIGVNLNLLGSLIKLINSNEKPDPNHINEAREIYRFIEMMPLKAVHQQKFDKMKKEVEDLIS